jgi:hypothetical protein
MTLRRLFFWTLLFFTLFVVYESVLSPLLERLLWDSDTPFVASKKSINPQGFALPLLIFLTWRIFKWSDPERLEEEIAEKKKAQEKKIGKNGYTNLMHLSGNGEIQEIQKLLTLSLADINAQDKGGYTALMYASSGGHLKVVELLLGLGADKELMTKKGNNALFFSKNNSHTEITLILQAAPPTTDKNNYPQSSANYSGESNNPSSMSTEEKITDFERRLDYRAKGLTEAQQEKLDTEFHNYARSRRLPD